MYEEQVSEEEVVDEKMAELVELLPRPTGYRLLVALPPVTEKIGSVFLPDDLKMREHTASIVGHVIAMGPDAYYDKNKFPLGPWCEKGDWVMFRAYSGSRFKVKDQEFRLINDDTVEAVVEDPRAVARAF